MPISAYPPVLDLDEEGGSTATLGFQPITTNHTGIGGTLTDVNGLSVTVTVPEGRRIRVSTQFQHMRTNADGLNRFHIREGETTLHFADDFVRGALEGHIGFSMSVILTPSAGTHTYKVSARIVTGSGTLSIGVDAGDPGFILVEDITGLPVPYANASVPVGVLGFAQITANVTGIGPSAVDINGLSVNIAVPAGRQLELSAYCPVLGGSGDTPNSILILMDGAQVTATEIQGPYSAHYASMLVSPSAGSHTIKVQAYSGNSGATFAAAPSFPGWLMVKDVTPTPAPSSGAPSSTLGYAEVKVDQGSIGTSVVDLNNLAVTVTVPTGRRIRISGLVPTFYSVSATSQATLYIREGSTILQRMDDTFASGELRSALVEVVVTPSPGTHTYKLSAQTGSGGMTLGANANAPAFILVEDITGSVWPEGSSVTAGMIASEAWDAWSPTLTNMTLGNGTLISRYKKLGRTVTAHFRFLLGSTSAMGTAPRFTLPVPFSATAYPDDSQLGTFFMTDVVANVNQGFFQLLVGVNRIGLRAMTASGTYVGFADITSAIPISWATNHYLDGHFTYEAAS